MAGVETMVAWGGDSEGMLFSGIEAVPIAIAASPCGYSGVLIAILVSPFCPLLDTFGTLPGGSGPCVVTNCCAC